MASGERDPGGAWPLGPIVRAGRERAGLSISEAARQARTSATTWTSVETGTRTTKSGPKPNIPQATIIVAVVSVLNGHLERADRIDIDKALELAGYEPAVHNPVRDPSHAGPPPVSSRVIASKSEQLTPRQRAAVHSIIESMLNPNGPNETQSDGTVWHVGYDERPRPQAGDAVHHVGHDEKPPKRRTHAEDPAADAQQGPRGN